MPETMSIERRKLLAAFGAKLVLTDGAKGMNGAIAQAEEIVAARPRPLRAAAAVQEPGEPAHPRARPPARRSGTTPTARSTSWSPASAPAAPSPASRATSSARKGKPICIGRGRAAHSPVITQTLAGQPLEPGPHKIQGIGAGFVPDVLDLSLVDAVEQVTNEESIDVARRLAREEGILSGISCGAAVAVAVRLAKRPENAGKTIVVVLPDSGERYLSTRALRGDASTTQGIAHVRRIAAETPPASVARRLGLGAMREGAARCRARSRSPASGARARRLPSREALVRDRRRACARRCSPRTSAPPDLADDGVDYFVGHTPRRARWRRCTSRCAAACCSTQRRLRRERAAQARAAEVDARLRGRAARRPRACSRADVRAAYEGDPAATSLDEAIFCYPGITAITHHRLAHELLPARRAADPAHHGRDRPRRHRHRHPPRRARSARSFFIDHGTGVVIGETTRHRRARAPLPGRDAGRAELPARRAAASPQGHRAPPDRRGRRRDLRRRDHPRPHHASARGSSIGGNVWLTRSVPPQQPRHAGAGCAASCSRRARIEGQKNITSTGRAARVEVDGVAPSRSRPVRRERAQCAAVSRMTGGLAPPAMASVGWPVRAIRWPKASRRRRACGPSLQRGPERRVPEPGDHSARGARPSRAGSTRRRRRGARPRRGPRAARRASSAGGRRVDVERSVVQRQPA